MQKKITILTSVLLTSYMCLCPTTQASESLAADTHHVNVIASRDSAVAKKFQENPRQALHLLDKVSEKALVYMTAPFLEKSNAPFNAECLLIEFDLPKDSFAARAMDLNRAATLNTFEASLQGKVPLEVLAAEGSFSAMRQLAEKATDAESRLKWVFIELLSSLGESVNFKGLGKAIEKGQTRQENVTKVALRKAAEWVREFIYQGQVVTADYQKMTPEEFTIRTTGAYNGLSIQGNPVGFFNEIAFTHGHPRSQYLSFFLHLGLSDVNIPLALKSLGKASYANFAPARELECFINYAMAPQNKVLRQLKLASKNSARKDWKGLHTEIEPITEISEAYTLLGRSLYLSGK